MQGIHCSTAGRWTSKEHENFLIGLQLFGKDWRKIQDTVKTRNAPQIRSHAQKYFLKHKNTTKINKNTKKQQEPIPSCQTPVQMIKYPIPSCQTPVQRSTLCYNPSYGQNCSFFMKKIFQFRENNQNSDIWEAMIDEGSSKQTVTQMDSRISCKQQNLISPKEPILQFGQSHLFEDTFRSCSK